MSHPSELWTWENCIDKMRLLSGRNGFPESRIISFLGYEFDTLTGRISDTLSNKDISRGDRSYRSISHTIFYVLSAYSDADENVPTGKKVSSRQFRGNQFTRRGYEGEAQNIVKHFGSNPEKLVKSAQVLGGRLVDFPVGDVVVEIYVLPRVPLILVLSLVDEEFPAKAWIYFDETIESYFDSEQIYFLTHLTVTRLIETMKK
jgi:hypothetical protein